MVLAYLAKKKWIKQQTLVPFFLPSSSLIFYNMLKPLSTTLNSTAEDFDTQPYFYTKSYGPLLFMVDLAGAKDPIGPSSLFHTCT